jgi:hypothetical protein
MKLFDTLKQFKNITPDAGFTQRSRTQILLSPQKGLGAMRGVFTFMHIIETGAAVALAGFFIFILAGSFPATRSIAPIQYAVIDPQGLHAEAQAIDMQIQLADVEYPQSTSTGPTPSAPVALTKVFAAALSAQATSSTSTSSPAVASVPVESATSTASPITPTTTLSVDQALTQLSQ